jgi:hypothetical protein
MAELGRWYNGYRFHSNAVEAIFNSDMVLYFVDNFDLAACRFPDRMLDENILSDYGKIMKLFGVGDREKNYLLLDELLTKGEVIARLKPRLDVVRDFDRADFISLLLYMGFVTISGTELTRLRYQIPNYVIEQLYFAYFKVEVEQRGQISIDSEILENAIVALALDGNITPLAGEMEKVMGLLSNRDFMQMDEKHVKVIILTLLYQSDVYFIQSEPEINNRYPDILLLERNPFKVNYQYLLELKYCKKGRGRQGWEEKKEQGIRQVQHYLELPDIKKLENLQSYLVVSNGSEVEVIRVSKGL